MNALVADRPVHAATTERSPAGLTCRSDGQGEPVLLLQHGLSGSGTPWQHITARLSRHHRVLTVDLRTQGASPPAAHLDHGPLSEELYELLDAQGLDEVAIVGHGVGGKLAMAFAQQYPHRTRSLAVVDIATASYSGSGTPLIYAALKVDLPAVDRPDTDWDWLMTPWQRIAAGMKRLLGFAPPPCKSPVPALFIGAAASDHLTSAGEPLIRALFAETVLDDIADADHWMHVDQPVALTQRLDDWLRQPVPPPPTALAPA